MTEEHKDLYYLEELSDYKISDDYPDIRKWKVVDTDDREIGSVDGLMVSKSAQRVVYLDIIVDESVIEIGHEIYSAKAGGVHEFLNKDGEDHLIVPIGMVTLDLEHKIVRSTQITHETFSKTKRFSKGMAINRDYELNVHGTFVPGFPKKIIENGRGFYDQQEFLIG